MATRTVRELDTIATSAVAAAGVASVFLETQIDGISAPESRQLGLDQIADLITADQKAVVATTSAVAIMSSSASITGTSSINTGLTTLAHVVLTIRGALASSAAAVSWSALASSGWFQARVYANPVSSSEAPVVSTIAQVVDWIAVGGS